jgi:glycine cleavage system H protein
MSGRRQAAIPELLIARIVMGKPEELLYSETHEWVCVEQVDGAKFATVGITAFAIEQLTDLVYMELPEVGSSVATGGEFGEVESVKAVSPLYSPVDGEVVAVNSELPDRLETLGQDPYGAGWLVKVRLSDEQSLARLMNFAAYQKQCADEGH